MAAGRVSSSAGVGAVGAVGAVGEGAGAAPSEPAEPSRSSARHPRRALGVAALWAFGVLPGVAGVARCPVAVLTHHACPGCGLTRATRLLLRGDLAASLHMHAMALPQLAASALVVVATVWAAYRLGTPTDVLQRPLGRAAAAAFLGAQALLAVYYVARLFGAFGGLPPV